MYSIYIYINCRNLTVYEAWLRFRTPHVLPVVGQGREGRDGFFEKITNSLGNRSPITVVERNVERAVSDNNRFTIAVLPRTRRVTRVCGMRVVIAERPRCFKQRRFKQN